MTLTTVDKTHQEKQQEHKPQSPIAIEFQNQILIKENKSYECTLMDNATFDFIRQKSPENQEPPIDTQHQNSLNDKKDNEHAMVNKLANDAAINIMVQKRGKRTKSCRIAVQILQQETKNDRVRYFIRWENPTSDKRPENSWFWADDVTEDLKTTFHKTHSLDGELYFMSRHYSNGPTFNSHSRNGELMSH